MGLKRVMWVRRYQGQGRALRPLGHQGYRLRSYKKDQPLCSGYTGLTPCTDTDRGVPQGGTEGPFLYLLVTLPLAWEYPGYTPYTLRSPLVNFAGDDLLTTTIRHRNPAKPGLPATSDQASTILQLTKTYLNGHHLLVHPCKSVGLADAGTPSPTYGKASFCIWRTPQSAWGSQKPPGITTLHYQTSWKGVSPNYLSLPGGPPVYAGPGVLHGGGTQRGPRVPGPTPPEPRAPEHHARQQVTKAWAQHGGWRTSFPKEAMMAHWRYYGENTGAPVDSAYAKDAEHLLHRMRHNHQPEVRKAAAVRTKEAQTARNTCPRCILAPHGVPTSVATGILTQLKLLLPHHTDAILKSHHCNQQGPLVARYGNIRRHPAGKVDSLRLVGATITIVYITPTQMKVMAQCVAQNAPFLADTQWPTQSVFGAYVRTCATKAGPTRPGAKDINAAYMAFQSQHPQPGPKEHQAPTQR